MVEPNQGFRESELIFLAWLGRDEVLWGLKLRCFFAEFRGLAGLQSLLINRESSGELTRPWHVQGAPRSKCLPLKELRQSPRSSLSVPRNLGAEWPCALQEGPRMTASPAMLCCCGAQIPPWAQPEQRTAQWHTLWTSFGLQHWAGLRESRSLLPPALSGPQHKH